MQAISNENRWHLAKVDNQGRISFRKHVREFIGLEANEYIYVMIEKTGKFSGKGLDLSKESEESPD